MTLVRYRIAQRKDATQLLILMLTIIFHDTLAPPELFDKVNIASVKLRREEFLLTNVSLADRVNIGYQQRAVIRFQLFFVFNDSSSLFWSFFYHL